ncbi:hypothetical protein M413DRAFT_449115 [Hebeloma cylindrosporum]|uniref:Major facilitator superfamily (MFS) profile domain-containing protein n=1 Tax=Hebeloma cylindrosporum TaxID=76867 RepID=A0A0C3BIQ2_HEBCY|nr:hypothetical protein M413DRAFT_449115 [Hebeloma cylindrosporum h7]
MSVGTATTQTLSSIPNGSRPQLANPSSESLSILTGTPPPPPPLSHLTYDIEHTPVKNDPRAWTPLRKNASLALIALASMVASLAANIQNPAVEEKEEDLPATSSQFSLSISLFILFQGVMPLLWSAVSEVKGRKLVYLVSLGLFTLGSVAVALSKRIGLVIGFRCLQGAGSSAVNAIGAATLADIFDPAERGKKVGIYYIALVLGPALGPIFGGVLTAIWNWRAIFWFLSVLGGLIFALFFIFFHDTFRRERSLTYQNILKQRLRSAALLPLSYSDKSSTAGRRWLQVDKPEVELEKAAEATRTEETGRELPADVQLNVTLSLTDVNPFKPLLLVVRRKNNFLIPLSSGLIFSFSFLVVYTTARTLARSYHYTPLKIGLVALAYGIGCILGSVVGGRWSDYEFERLSAANGGKGDPEMRLGSTVLGVIFFPPSVVAFGWICEKHVHVAVICVFLFLTGFFSILIYSSSLTYIVDANVGRSSTAVATNSAFRGMAAFIATEIAVPLQDGVGDGLDVYTLGGY